MIMYTGIKLPVYIINCKYAKTELDIIYVTKQLIIYYLKEVIIMKKLLLIAIVALCAVNLFFGPTEEELHQHDISAEETAEIVTDKVNAKAVNHIIEEKESKVWFYK